MRVTVSYNLPSTCPSLPLWRVLRFYPPDLAIFCTLRQDSFEAWEGLYHTKGLPAELKFITFVQRSPICFSGHLVGDQDQCRTAFPPVPLQSNTADSTQGNKGAGREAVQERSLGAMF